MTFDWISIALSALIGGLSALLAALFVKDRREKPAKFAIAVAVSFGALKFASTVLLMPRINLWRADHALQAMPVYVAISKYEPNTYERIRKTLADALNGGMTSEQAIGRAHPLIVGMVGKYAPKASDETVVKVAQITIREIEELENDGTENCYYLIYPRAGGGSTNPPKFSAGLAADEMAVMADLINEGASQPIPPMDSATAGSLVQEIIQGLVKTHPDEIRTLAKGSQPDVDKRLVCAGTADLFKAILKTPSDQRGSLLRFVLSQKN
jgi:hypothetical protein